MPRIRQYADKYAMKDLASHICGRMKECGLSQQQLAEKTQVSQQTISRLLKHPETISIGMLRKMEAQIGFDRDVLGKILCGRGLDKK